MLELLGAVGMAGARELLESAAAESAPAWLPSEEVTAVGTNLGQILLFETERHTQQLTWKAHDSYVYSLAWTPDGTRLISVSGDATARIWDTRTREQSRVENERWRALLGAVRARAGSDGPD